MAAGEAADATAPAGQEAWQDYQTVFTNAKAGMQGVDKERIQRIVYEMSKDSGGFRRPVVLAAREKDMPKVCHASRGSRWSTEGLRSTAPGSAGVSSFSAAAQATVMLDARGMYIAAKRMCRTCSTQLLTYIGRTWLHATSIGCLNCRPLQE